MSNSLLLYILLLPLVGAAINGLLGKKMSVRLVEGLACLSIFTAFVAVVFLAVTTQGPIYFELTSSWIPYGTAATDTIGVALFMDSVTQLMLLLITGVGFLIHVYSVGYMEHDSDRPRYFAYLNLFVFFMLALVLSNNLLTLFVGWEGVGLCSYLLIGFWFKDQKNAIAGKKAFIVNRVGDAAFILGMLTLLTQFGTLNVHSIAGGSGGLVDLVHQPTVYITLATLLLFIGACGKSAQFPLLVWLPNAMAGPTPVSALIHAATMVTAGVYMVVRLNFMFVLAPMTMDIIAAIGIFTAFFAAAAALGQQDIKKVLAYSTVSQLGYMFLGLGVGAFSASMFHLITHGFFKALLFLSAGSVIHATHGEQDINKMGGLKNYLIPTTLCFAAGSLALSGFPLMSGWFSKGAILSACFASHNYFFWGMGLLTAMMTAFYTVRLFMKVFLGTPKMPKENLAKLHESPNIMILPMSILALLSVIGGYGIIGISHLAETANLTSEHAHHDVWATVAETGAILFAIIIAWRIYSPDGIGTEPKKAGWARLRDSAERAFYLDELVTYLIGCRGTLLIANASRWFETRIVDGTLNALTWTTQQFSLLASYMQRSTVKSYVYSMFIGFVVLLWLVLWK